MQHYLLDSNQRLNASFSRDSVTTYYQCFNQPHREEVPPLMYASLRPRFDLPKKHANSELILAESATDQTQKMKVDTIYVRHLEDIECRQTHNITRCTMALTLARNDQYVMMVT